MITSVAELLAAFQAKQVDLLKSQTIVHAPTIGEMYEGLTRKMLKRTIPASFGLRIVDGFVMGHDGTLSPQVDAMLVMGDAGLPIPNTSRYTWPIRDVLAVFEVKKNLFGKDLADGLAKMGAISIMYRAYLRANEPTAVNLGPSSRAFARLAGRFPLQEELEDLRSIPGEWVRMIAAEQLAPVRVVWGYEGYADETALRGALVEQIKKNLGEEGLAPPALPNLIICRRNSILKLTGHPYIVPLDDDWWVLAASDRDSPIRLLIELVWTRLSNQFDAAFPMDDTLGMERLAPLLWGHVETIGSRLGWRYRSSALNRKDLSELKDSPATQWQPAEVDVNEVVVIQMACLHGGLSVDDPAFVRHSKREGFDTRTIIEGLVSKRLFAWTSKTTARPIANTIQMAMTPDGRQWASENGKLLQLWIQRNWPGGKKPVEQT